MSLLLASSNGFYLKYSLPIFSRYLCNMDAQHLCVIYSSRNNLHSQCYLSRQIRSATSSIRHPTMMFKRSNQLQMSSMDDKQPASNRYVEARSEFPPGNPNDRPKLEHLRFIETELIRIVNLVLFFLCLVV
jgi:hypothetical protein